jgi:hypothetical protein
MRRLVLAYGVAALAATAMFAPQASAGVLYEGPWCMHEVMGRGGVISKCDIPNYEACRAQMRGMGGTYCTQNPYYNWQAAAEPTKRRVKKSTRM